MSPTDKPVELFVSYSHADRRHLDTLRQHLAPLEASGRVHCWWDGNIDVGEEWRPQIIDALHRADIVLLLLTASYLSKLFCVEVELAQARKREKEGQIDLLPIWVDAFDEGAHWVGELQAITCNGKAIVQSHLGNAAWKSVARQIRLKVECMEGKRPVMQALNEVDEVVHSGDVGLGDLPPHARTLRTAEFASVSAFWKATSTVLREGLDLVEVRGTLSHFAPMLMGPPRAKRVLHREFRKAIEAHRHFGERKRLTINACMSISAGQMVHREVRGENKKRLLGLYESIVRNAIPIFALTDYYERELLPTLRETRGSECIEAVVTGRPFLLDNSYIRRFLARQGIDQILEPIVIDDLCRDAYALEVGGPGTRVRPLLDEPVRYLDGDIWLAAAGGGAERFITGFVDVTCRAEREEEMDRLRRDAGGRRIIAAYDELRSVAQLLDSNEG